MANAPVRVSADTHRKLTLFRLQVSAELGRDITMGDIVDSAFLVAEKHRDEVMRILAGKGENSS